MSSKKEKSIKLSSFSSPIVFEESHVGLLDLQVPFSQDRAVKIPKIPYKYPKTEVKWTCNCARQLPNNHERVTL